MGIMTEQERMQAAREARMRRIAAATGLQLIKYRDSSRWFNQYGPYALADRQTNVMVAWGIADLAAVERELSARAVDE